jgi:hypothetical protein
MNALVALIVLSGASEAGQDRSNPRVVPHEIVHQGAYSQIEAPLAVVIRKDEELKDYERRLGRELPKGARPVNWGRHQLVAVHAGSYPSGGYTVEVQRARRVANDLVVRIEVKGPPPGAMTTMALTQPYVVLRTPRTEGGVRLERRGAPPMKADDRTSERN